MTGANKDVRRAARCNGIPQWKIASELGISEPTLCRWLRFELAPDKKQKIFNVIEKLSKEVG